MSFHKIGLIPNLPAYNNSAIYLLFHVKNVNCELKIKFNYIWKGRMTSCYKLAKELLFLYKTWNIQNC